jgi:hypothetical protein
MIVLFCASLSSPPILFCRNVSRLVTVQHISDECDLSKTMLDLWRYGRQKMVSNGLARRSKTSETGGRRKLRYDGKLTGESKKGMKDGGEEKM